MASDQVDTNSDENKKLPVEVVEVDDWNGLIRYVN